MAHALNWFILNFNDILFIDFNQRHEFQKMFRCNINEYFVVFYYWNFISLATDTLSEFDGIRLFVARVAWLQPLEHSLVVNFPQLVVEDDCDMTVVYLFPREVSDWLKVVAHTFDEHLSLLHEGPQVKGVSIKKELRVEQIAFLTIGVGAFLFEERSLYSLKLALVENFVFQFFVVDEEAVVKVKEEPPLLDVHMFDDQSPFQICCFDQLKALSNPPFESC